VTALLWALALSAAPGCPEALARAAALPPPELAQAAGDIVSALGAAGAGPTGALARAARAAEEAGGTEREGAAAEAFRAALERHCALAASAAAPLATPGDRAALAEVLARPELARTRTDLWAIARALDRLWDWIVDLLGTTEAERYASVGRALFLGAAAGAAVLALSALRRRAARARREGDGPEARGAAGAEPADASAARAEEALARREWREAVRLALLAALGALEQAGRIPRGRALTNGEVVASFPSDDLSALARAFDRAIYGALPVAPEEARAALERAHRIAAGAGGPG
jgi:hypothetical protein